jgi:two-component system, OmpR family, copper resistance phosphate regulon response regulator CusR
VANILIIDDDPVYSDMMRQRLSRAGHNVSVHVGPFGGTLAARKDGLDLIILDVFMPGLDGPSLLDLLRKDGTWRPKVIFCSSMDSAPLRELARQHQADGSITKAGARHDLMEYIDSVLMRRRANTGR